MKSIMKFALTLAVAFMALSVIAQPPAPKKPQPKSPKEIAQMRTDRMNTVVTLNDKQQKEIYDFYLKDAEGASAEKAKIAAITDPEARKAAIKKLADERAATLKKILSPEQYQKWEAYKVQQMKEHRGKKSPRGPQGDCVKRDSCQKADTCTKKDCPKKK